jgi:MATE family multidrug resistance protein
MTIFAAMYILIPKFITKIFQNDPNVIILSASLITIMAIFQITYGISMIASAILNGAGDVKFTMISSILSTWLISIPICYFLAIAIKMKAEGVWIGLSIKAFVLFLIMTIRLFSNKWKKIKIIKNINN